jgi:hypothetical protein
VLTQRRSTGTGRRWQRSSNLAGGGCAGTDASAARPPDQQREDVVIEPKELADRYVAVWTEPDTDRRRQRITQLWAEDGVHILEPPQEVRETAATLGMTPTLKACGHDALQVRVTRSYEQFVAGGGFIFRARDNAARLDDVVKFNWEMVRTSDGEVAGVGLDILVLDDDGRIRIDYQFIEP